MLVISTAGFDKHSILYELYTHAKAVQENPDLDPSFLPLIFEAPADANWRSEKVWKKCNPALGDFRIARRDARGVRAGRGDPGAREYVSAVVFESVDGTGVTGWIRARARGIASARCDDDAPTIGGALKAGRVMSASTCRARRI